MSCDNTGGHPVLQREKIVGLVTARPAYLNIRRVDPRAGTLDDPPPEKGWGEGVLQRLFDWEKILSDAWDDALDEIPLLLV